jgi:origin recognition complex subunit 1
LEAINGKATILSEKTFYARHPSGKISRKSPEYGKAFICRRGCNTRSATYTDEFVWEDIYQGTEGDIEALIDRIKTDTKATRKRHKSAGTTGDDIFEDDGAGDEPSTPRKRQKTSAASTPRKPRTPSKLVTPGHKRWRLIISGYFGAMLIST